MQSQKPRYAQLLLASALLLSITSGLHALDIQCPSFYEDLSTESEILERFRDAIENKKVSSLEKRYSPVSHP